uniref:Uncharacterized protein n=1 Tax=Bracon brevicornis TaxID=1563983 RepID=A0A6V7JFA4_9HYME
MPEHRFVKQLLNIPFLFFFKTPLAFWCCEQQQQPHNSTVLAVFEKAPDTTNTKLWETVYELGVDRRDPRE